MCCVVTPELGRAGVLAQLESSGFSCGGYTLLLHRSRKFQETPCSPAEWGREWRLRQAGSLALGEQMCLPQGEQQKKVQTRVCLLTIKEMFVRGPWRGGLVWGALPDVLTGSPQRPLCLAGGAGEWAVRNQGCGSCWVIFLRCTATSKHSCLQLLKEAGPEEVGSLPTGGPDGRGPAPGVPG